MYYVLSSAFSNVSSQNDPPCVFLLVVFNNKKSERFEPRSHFTSRLSLIVRVKVFLNRTVFVEKGGSPKYFIYVWGIYKNANSHSQNQGFENFIVLKVFTSYYTLSQDVDTFYLFLNWFSTPVRLYACIYTKIRGFDSREITSLPEKKKSYLHVTSFQSSPKVNRMLLTRQSQFCSLRFLFFSTTQSCSLVPK